MRPLPAIAVLVLAAACANPSGPAPTGSPEPSPRDIAAVAIAEAVHRRQFVEYLREPQVNPITYCLVRSVETESGSTSRPATWTDPPEPLMRQFAGHEPPVKTMKLCQLQPNLAGAIDLETGGRAVVFRATAPIWESDTEAIVHGGYYFGGLSASGETYRVRFEGGRWLVVHVELNWVA
jgi:hypothetical protein